MRPSPVFVIILLRLTSALPFAVFYSSLQLYLLSTGFSQHNSTSLVGSVLALSFSLSLIGGYIAGKYINYKSFFIFCVFCQSISCLMFAVSSHELILMFCTLFLLGSSGLTISLNMMVTQLFKPNDGAREKYFFVFYMALNLGYFTGYLLAGYHGNINAYYNIPIFVISFSILNFVLILFYWHSIDNSQKNLSYSNKLQFLLIMLILFFITWLLLHYSREINLIIILSWIITAFLTLSLLLKKFPGKRNDLFIFSILLFTSLLFWSTYFLAPMALIVFIKHHVNLYLANIKLAPQWIQNTNTIVVILGTLIIGTKSDKNSFNINKIITQFTIGLTSMGLGFGLLAYGIILTSPAHKLMLIWVILSYILQSIGELFIGPIGYSLVGRLIPKIYQSLMMGIWVTVLGVGSAFASELSSMMPYNSSHNAITLVPYQYLFSSISILTLILAGLIYKGSKLFLKTPIVS